MSTPNVNVYQAAQSQYTTPAVPVLVENTITLSTGNTNVTVPVSTVQSILQTMNMSAAPAIVLPKVTQTIPTILAENNPTAAFSTSQSSQHNVASQKTQANVPAQKSQPDIAKQTTQTSVNEIITNSQQKTFNMKKIEHDFKPQTSTKDTVSLESTEARYDKVSHRTNTESFISKRLAIRNREVNNECFNQPIPLHYAPIRPIQDNKMVEKQNKSKDLDVGTHENEKLIKEINGSIFAKCDKSIENNCEEISPTLHNNSIANTKETSKENKESPSCRSILLRSTHKLNAKACSSVNADKPVGRKTKVRLKVAKNTKSDVKMVANAANEKPVLTEVPADKEPNTETEQLSVKKLQNDCDKTKVKVETVNSHPTRMSKRILNRKIKKSKEKQSKITQPKQLVDKNSTEEVAIFKSQVNNVTNVQISNIIDKNDIFRDNEDKFKGFKNNESFMHETIDELEKSVQDKMMSSCTTQKPTKPNKLSTKAEEEKYLSADCTMTKRETTLALNSSETTSVFSIQKEAQTKVDLYCRKSVSVVKHCNKSKISKVTSEELCPSTKKVKSSKHKLTKLVDEIENVINEITHESTVGHFSDKTENLKVAELMEVNTDILGLSPNKIRDKIIDPKLQNIVLDTTKKTVNERKADEHSNSTASVMGNTIDLTVSASEPITCDKNNTCKGKVTVLSKSPGIEHLVQVANKSSDALKENTNDKSRKYAESEPLPQAYIDNLRFEELPFRDPNDPYTRIVRVQLPNGKIFKATIFGKANVNFRSLFQEPRLKNILLSGARETTRYTLNIQQLTTPNQKVLETKVHEINIETNATTKQNATIEMVNLISDDEDDTSPPPPAISFVTEFGTYKTKLIDKDLFTRHQTKFLQKCAIKLNKCQAPGTSIDIVKPVSIFRNPTLTANKIGNMDLVINRCPKDLLIPDNTPCETIIPDVIEIDDSSNDSLQIADLEAAEKITTLKNLLLKDLGVAEDTSESSTQTRRNEENINTQVTSAQHFLNELGRENEEIFDEKRTSRNKARLITDTKNEELFAHIINREYYVKLVRCDDQVKGKETIPQHVMEKNDRCDAIVVEDIEVDCSVIDPDSPMSSRSGSFSILNDLTFDDTPIADDDRSSPVINIFETISSLRVARALERSSPVIEVFDMMVRSQNRFQVFKDAGNEKEKSSVCLERFCDSEWFLTKSGLRYQNQVVGKYSRELSETMTDDKADSSTDCESDFVSTVLTNVLIEDSTYTFQVPKLTTILARYFADNPLVIRLKHSTKTFEVPKLTTIMAKYFEDNPLVIRLKHCSETIQVPSLSTIMWRYFENNPLVTRLQHLRGIANVGIEKGSSPLKRKLQNGEEIVASKLTKVIKNANEDIDVDDEIIQVYTDNLKTMQPVENNTNVTEVTESATDNISETFQTINSEVSSPTEDLINDVGFEDESQLQNINSLNVNVNQSIGPNVTNEIDIIQHIPTIVNETSNIIEDNMETKSAVYNSNAQDCSYDLTSINTEKRTELLMNEVISSVPKSNDVTDVYYAVQIKEKEAESSDITPEMNTNHLQCELKTENIETGRTQDKVHLDDLSNKQTLTSDISCKGEIQQVQPEKILISDTSNNILKVCEVDHSYENIDWIGYETEIGDDSCPPTTKVSFETLINPLSLEQTLSVPLIDNKTVQTDVLDNKNEQPFHIDHSGCHTEFMANIDDYCNEVVIVNDNHTYLCESVVTERELLSDDSQYDIFEQGVDTRKSWEHNQDENGYCKELQSSTDGQHVEETSDVSDSNNTSVSSKQDDTFLEKSIVCVKDFDESDIEKNTTCLYKDDCDVILKGIPYEHPELGTCYVFPLSKSSDSSTPTEASGCSDNVEVGKDLDHNINTEETEHGLNDEDLKLLEPQITYKRPKKKRKLRLSEVYASAKKRKNAKTLKTRIKNINLPKFKKPAALFDASYIEQYTRLFDYYSTIEFSYAVSYSKDFIDVPKLIKDWPIKGPCKQECEEETEVVIDLFTGDNENYIFDPVEMTVAEEITSAHEIPCDKTEDHNADMGFGEGSGRVIQNLENDGAISKFSAATLSDVKLLQPFLLSEKRKCSNNANFQIENQDQHDKIRRCFNYFKLRSKVQSFFKNIEIELNRFMPDLQKDKNQAEDTPTFPFDLYIPALPEPSATNVVVQVVQVGQLPVSAAAQNPVTCDPRVTQVSNASPSQCTLDNSPQDGSQAIKTEYTELTTAEMTLPLVQDYAQQNSDIKIEEQESTNISLSNENIPIETEIKTEIKDEIDSDNPEEIDDRQKPANVDQHNANVNNMEYSYETNNTIESEQNLQLLFGTEKQPETFTIQKATNGATEKTDQIAHAMNAAGITTTETATNNKANANTFVNLLSQKLLKSSATSTQNSSNNSTKTINAMSLQQALAQILPPPPLNQTNTTENNQQNQNALAPQVVHIVQGKNAAGNQITLVDNSQPTVINTPNATPVLHIVQNKSVTSGPITNGASSQPGNSFSGLSLVDAGLQQGGNQLLHIVNAGNQKNSNAGQLLKRVNLLTNLQGTNEQKLVQFVCKSADGKSIQLNAGHQRGMVLRLQPIEPPNIQTSTTKLENQELSPTATPASSKDSASQQEIKSRSMYEENYAKFIQNVATKTQILEKSTSLPKFNQAFGKQVFQDGVQKQNDLGNNLSSVNATENPECTPPAENSVNLDHINPIGSPPLLLRKPAHVSQPQQIKQTIAPMNIQTMHGGVIYTRQIPVNIAGGQTINLIVPSTEFDESGYKHQSDVKYQSEIEPSIIKIVPQTASSAEVTPDDGNNPLNTSSESSQNPQPVLTQMRIKLPMLSKAPQMVPGARVVRPSFFQIQRNVIGGANQPVYQQLVLTAAPPLGQQTIRLPQSQTRSVKVESQTSESHMSSSTLEQLREFDMVLEQVKERSTGQPNSATGSNFKLNTSSTDNTDSSASTTSTPTATTQVLYSICSNQPLNVTYVNRKATVTTPTTCTFVRSPDSSGIVDSPSSSNHVHLPRTVTAEASTSEIVNTAPPKPKFKSKSRPKHHHSSKVNSVPPKASTQKPLEDEQTTQRILYILAEYKEQVENSPDKDKPAPRRRTNPPTNPSGSSKRKKSSSGSRRADTRDDSPVLGEDTCRTMGSEDSSCGTSQGDCAESCHENQSPQDSPRKVARKLTFEPERPVTPPPRPSPQQRNVIVSDGQTITVARGTAGKPTTATVLMPANYILPVSMMKGGQQIAIVTNRGPKLLTVGGGEGGATNALLLQRLIGPAGLKPVLTRPGVRHVRLPTAALHNLQTFNLASTTNVQPPDSTASPASAHTPPELVDTHATSSPWADRESESIKPRERASSPEGSWHLPSSADPNDYCYEETVRATDSLGRTVLVSCFFFLAIK